MKRVAWTRLLAGLVYPALLLLAIGRAEAQSPGPVAPIPMPGLLSPNRLAQPPADPAKATGGAALPAPVPTGQL